MPYDGRHGGNGWDHRGHGRDRDHDRFGLFGFYGFAGYPYLPWWGWGDPYLLDYWNDGGGYDAPAGDYASQPYSQYPQYAPYDMPPDQGQPQASLSATQPYSQPAPTADPAPIAPGAPVTLVFKDGRPNQQIHNYLLTPTTLSVLDPHHQDIPVDQIDLGATTALNRQAGVDFALPGASR